MKNKKVLFILHLPPPVHGASMVGKYIHDSETINNTFECHYLNLTLAKDINDIGKGGIRKLKRLLQAANTDKKTSEIYKAATLLCNPQCKRRCLLQRILRCATTENIKPKNYHSLS